MFPYILNQMNQWRMIYIVPEYYGLEHVTTHVMVLQYKEN